jgi:hypothetical protein
MTSYRHVRILREPGAEMPRATRPEPLGLVSSSSVKRRGIMAVRACYD